MPCAALQSGLHLARRPLPCLRGTAIASTSHPPPLRADSVRCRAIVGGVSFSDDHSDTRPSDAPPVEERVLSLSEILDEIRAESNDFVFEDGEEDEPVWEHESRFAASPAQPSAVASSRTPDFDPFEADTLSAYSPEQGFAEISPEQLQADLEAQHCDLLIDVSTAAEYSEARVPTSRLLPMTSLGDTVRAGDLDDFKDKRVVVLCQSGSRSAQACVKLSKVFGFSQVVNVKGGTLAWMGLGLPVEKGQIKSEGSCGSGCGCH